ncbi:hypothetical protein V6000_008319 [Aspergillus fumigatus]
MNDLQCQDSSNQNDTIIGAQKNWGSLQDIKIATTSPSSRNTIDEQGSTIWNHYVDCGLLVAPRNELTIDIKVHDTLHEAIALINTITHLPWTYRPPPSR